MEDQKPQTMPRETKVVLSVLVFSALVMMLNETILSVALPSIMQEFSIEATTAQWLTTGFMLTMAVVIPTTGYLLQRITTRAVFIAALLFFTVGTIIAALAPSFTVLLLGRIIQAVGTAIIMPLMTTFALTVVPENRRGTVMGLIAVVMAVAPALGPTASGLILNWFTWHWLFWVMVPLAIIALGIGMFYISNLMETSKAPLDVFSVILSAFAFGGLVYGLSSMSTIIDGEGSARNATIAVSVVGALALIWFVFRQLRLEPKGSALLNLKPFALKNFTLPVIVLLTVFASLLGSVTVLPIYLQTSLGVTAMATGLLMLPGSLMNAILSPFIGRIYDSVGPRPLLWPGTLIATAALYGMSRMDENTSTGLFITLHIVFSIALALMISPLMTTALGSLPKDLYSHGSAILNTLQQLAGAAGTALLVLILTRGTQNAAASGLAEEAAVASGSGNAFAISAILAFVAFFVSVFIRSNPRTVNVAEEVSPKADVKATISN